MRSSYRNRTELDTGGATVCLTYCFKTFTQAQMCIRRMEGKQFHACIHNFSQGLYWKMRPNIHATAMAMESYFSGEN